MTGVRTFARGAALSGISTAVSLVSLLAIGKMAALALPPEDVAFFMLVLLACDALNLFSNFGLFASVPKLVAEQKDPVARGRLMVSILAGQGIAGVMASAAMLIAAGLLPAQRDVLMAAAPLGILGAFRDTLLSALAGMHRYGAHMIASVVLSVGQALSVYLLMWVTMPTIEGLLSAVYLSQTIGLALLLMLVGRHLHGPIRLRSYLSSVRFSIPLWINTLLNFLFQRFDTVLITAALGLQGTAIYETAKRFPQSMARVLNALLLPWLPTITQFIAEGRREDAAKAVGMVLCIITWMGYCGVLLGMLLSRELVLLLASPEYLDAAPLLGWLMCGIHFAVQAGVFGQTLIALGKPAAVTRANIMQAAVSIAVTFMLLPRFGLFAPGYAWCASAGISLAMQMHAVRKQGLLGSARIWAALHGIFLVGVMVVYLVPGTAGNALGFGLFFLLGGALLAPMLPMLLSARKSAASGIS